MPLCLWQFVTNKVTSTIVSLVQKEITEHSNNLNSCMLRNIYGAQIALTL